MEGAEKRIHAELKTAQARGELTLFTGEHFGAAILRDAKSHGFIIACPTEKSGQKEFDFEFGADFARHIETIQPSFRKVLVRDNPGGDTVLNRRQAERLRTLSDYFQTRSQSRFMFELLVPAEREQLERLKGDKNRCDLALRPKLMAQTIEELQDARVEPNIWKVEGLDRREDFESVF
jgi:5-dehydro-2-deoxygluconokinase